MSLFWKKNQQQTNKQKYIIRTVEKHIEVLFFGKNTVKLC